MVRSRAGAWRGCAVLNGNAFYRGGLCAVYLSALCLVRDVYTRIGAAQRTVDGALVRALSKFIESAEVAEWNTHRV